MKHASGINPSRVKWILCRTGGLIALLLLGSAGAAIGEPQEAKNARHAQTDTQQAANLIPNPSFEENREERPAAWQQITWTGKCVFEYARLGHTDKHCVSIASDEGADVAWACMVPVDPFAKYRLSGWIKTENVTLRNGRGACFNIQNIQPLATPAVTGTNDWTRVELEFESGEQDALQINCLFGGWGQAIGRAWYDDVRLEQIGKTPIPEPRITIDASRAGEPISKYIYGQFIEHLGRCIYGGIWAEMLQDRKFFYPVGANDSPWRPIGGSDAVTMVREQPFVNEHMPRVNLDQGAEPRGLSHGGLGLIAGKEYVGRIWLAGTPDAGPVSVSLVWGDAAADRQTVTLAKVGAEWAKSPLKFRAAGATDDGRLEISAVGGGHLDVGPVSLMPADNVDGLRADTLALLRELNAPVYRWPGGNFVSGYDWHDGIGDPDKRPTRKNPAWEGIEHNDFGLDEFMNFCRLIRTEPYVTVNSGLGEVGGAVEELEYANAAADTPMGKLRAANGHATPYGVKFWAIGNEMYGDWQLGHMPLDKYIQKHNRYSEAMRAIDPSIQVIAVGAVGEWSEEMLRRCADHMDLISEHFYCGSQPGLNGHVRQIPDQVKRIAEAHRRYRKKFDTLRGKNLRVALDEWNYWYGPDIFGQIGTRYFLKDALGVAAGLHEYARNSDLYFMANYAQTVNVIGCIKTNKTAAQFETTGLVLKLYREHFGTIPVATECTPLLDAQAAWSADRRTLTIGVVNARQQAAKIALDLKDVKLSGAGTRWQIAGDDPMAFNDPGRSPVVTIETAPVKGIKDTLDVAPCSVTLFALGVE